MNEIFKNRIRELVRGPGSEELLALIEAYVADPSGLEAQLKQDAIAERENLLVTLEDKKASVHAELTALKK